MTRADVAVRGPEAGRFTLVEGHRNTATSLNTQGVMLRGFSTPPRNTQQSRCCGRCGVAVEVPR